MPDQPHAADDDSHASGVRLASHVLESKETLATAWAEAEDLHRRGAAPLRVAARLTRAADEVVCRVWRAALGRLEPREARDAANGCVLVAHGGYGRRQLAPRSDFDLMLLHQASTLPVAKRLAGWVTTELFDAGVELGHSVRSIDEALALSREDAMVATSLLESRQVIGSAELYERFGTAITANIRRRGSAVCQEFVDARKRERDRYGETLYLLEPNVKRSRGGLRDMHLLRWLWFVQTGVSDLDRLLGLGVISKFDHHRLCASRDFLMRVRNELHFSATRATDSLSRHEQLRVAESLGYRDGEGMLAVERFMRDYFRHAGHIWFLANRVSVLTTRKRSVASVLEPVLSRQVEKRYRLGYTEVSVAVALRDKVCRDPGEVFALLDVARDHDKRIAQECWYAIYRAAPEMPKTPSAETAATFLRVLKKPKRLAALLRRAHDLSVLEKVIPEFAEARYLLQFNQYHKFTVDEHSLQAVEMATRFLDREDLLGQVCLRIEDRALLNLALLLHDLGKARVGDHSVVGERIARDTAERLGLDPERGERLATLVRRHLTMSHLAFRRDTNDPALLDDLGRLAGDAETLSMLFVLTCADMAAVGPGVLNDWKIGMLADLHQRTLDRMADNADAAPDRRRSIRDAVWKLLEDDEATEGHFAAVFDALPESFVTSRSPQATAGVIRRMRRVAARQAPATDGVGRPDADAWGGYLQDASTLELIAAVADGAGRGVFSSMAGALTSKGLQILAAETILGEDQVLLLRYVAHDPRAAGNAAEANRRVTGVTTAMVHAIDNHTPPELPRLWGDDRAEAQAALSAAPSAVRIDTDLSDESAIVEVFTIDRVGLLYELARALHEMGLVIRFAKIATSLDQVVDVFYVTERDDTKPTAPARIQQISQGLMAIIEGGE